MKYAILALAVITMTACDGRTAEVTSSEKGTGGCKKCSCPSWRSDSGEPEKCINIKPPTKDLCQHSASDHK